MEWIYPLGFLGIGGIILPFIIHLLSKSKKQEIKFGSIAFLEETETNKAKNLQLNQIPLLVTRSFILIGISFLLAQLGCSSTTTKNKLIYVESGIQLPQSVTTQFNEADIVPFLINRQAFSDTLTFNNYHALADYISTEKDSAVVYSRGTFRHLDNQPILLSPHIKWQIVPSEKRFHLEKKEGPIVVEGDESSMHLKHIEGEVLDTVSYHISYADKDRNHAVRLKSILDALNNDQVLYFNEVLNQAEWEFSINQKASKFPAIEWEIKGEGCQFQQLSPIWWKLSCQLNESSILDHNIGHQLYQVFLSERLDKKIEDPRILDDPSIIRTTDVNLPKAYQRSPANKWIILILIILIIAERTLAFSTYE